MLLRYSIRRDLPLIAFTPAKIVHICGYTVTAPNSPLNIKGFCLQPDFAALVTAGYAVTRHSRRPVNSRGGP
jgi:hypothetical protein